MRNLLLLSFFLCISTFSIAQLYVRPTPSGPDNYIYVQDQVLFVEQGIQLVSNNTVDAEPSIYLREQSQLIQGYTVSPVGTPNSGTGTISVYQETEEDDAWDYSYWNSPVGKVLPWSPTSGNLYFSIQAYNDSTSVRESVQAQTTPDRNGFSSPVLTLSRRWTYKRPTGSDFIRIYETGPVYPGEGYMHKGVDTSPHTQRYDFRGRPNNGDITFALPNDPDGGITGNPYPSALDLHRFFWDADNNEISEILFWEEDRDVNTHFWRDRASGFGVWVPNTVGETDPNGEVGLPGYEGGLYTEAAFYRFDDGGTPTTGPGGGGTGGAYPRRFAPIGQGFVLVNTNGGNDEIVFKNSHRRYIKEGVGSDSQFRTPNSGASVTATPDNRPPHLRINVKLDENNNGQSFNRILLLSFNELATDNFDRGLDGHHPGLGTDDAFFPIGEDNDRKPYVIQGIKYELGKRVPISFTLSEQKTIHIGVAEEVNTDVNPFLWDSHNNIWYPIDDGQVASILLNQGTYDNRFFIVFRGIDAEEFTNQTAGLQPILPTINFFQNNRAGQLEVGNPDGYEISSAHIFDMNGRLVLERFELGNSMSFVFPTSNLSDGVYLVKLTTSDNQVIDYKMSVFNK